MIKKLSVQICCHILVQTLDACVLKVHDAHPRLCLHPVVQVCWRQADVLLQDLIMVGGLFDVIGQLRC